MKTNYLLTVLMVVRNGMPYIKESVDSILRQSYNKFEFLIIDNASNDKTSDYLRAINDSRVMIKSYDTIGIPNALNFGLQFIETKYTAIMDADDISESNRLEYEIKYLENNPSIGLVGTSVIFFSNRNKYNWRVNLPGDSEKIKNGLFNDLYVLVHPTVMFRTDLVKSIGGYRKESFPVPDLDLFLRLSKKTKIANIENLYCFCRIDQNSFTSKNLKKIVIKSKEILDELNNKKKPINSILVRNINNYSRFRSQYFYKKGLINYLDGNRVIGTLFFLFASFFNPYKAIFALKKIDFKNSLKRSIILYK